MTECTFELAWVGKCKSKNCTKHAQIKCVCCGAQAIRECPETFGFVCGSPLCGDCEHELTEEGVNFSGCKHVRKGEQKHLPWFAREPEAV